MRDGCMLQIQAYQRGSRRIWRKFTVAIDNTKIQKSVFRVNGTNEDEKYEWLVLSYDTKKTFAFPFDHFYFFQPLVA